MNRTWTYHKVVASLAYAAGLVSLVIAVTFSLTGGIAHAAPLGAVAPGLGAAGGYSALGKAGVTNTGPSVLQGNVGADGSITGFPPGSAGGTYLAPDVNGAEADASTADLLMTSQAGSASSVGPDLTGLNLVPGVYAIGSAGLSGELTLNGAGVYVFLADALSFSGSVSLTNGAAACNVYWHVSSGASLSGGSFVGTIIAGTSITFGDGVSMDGRALALTGNVTLINNSIFGPSCAAAPTEAPPATAVPPTDVPATSVPGATSVSPASDTATSVPPVSAPVTSVPGATAVRAAATSVSGATATAVVPVLIPVTGADLTARRGQLINLSLGFLGLGFVLVGFALLHKRK